MDVWALGNDTLTFPDTDYGHLSIDTTALAFVYFASYKCSHTKTETKLLLA